MGRLKSSRKPTEGKGDRLSVETQEQEVDKVFAIMARGTPEVAGTRPSNFKAKGEIPKSGNGVAEYVGAGGGSVRATGLASREEGRICVSRKIDQR